MIALFLFNELLFEALEFSLLIQVSFFLAFEQKGHPFLFGLLGLQLPLFDFSLHFKLLFGPVVSLVAFVVDLKLHVLDFCFFLAQFFLSFVHFVL